MSRRAPRPATDIGDLNRELQELYDTYMPMDESGNIIANVVPRTDNLTQLLAVTDAGNGEIASPLDKPKSIVKYLGSPSVGKEIRSGTLIGRIFVRRSTNQTSVASGDAIAYNSTVVDDFPGLWVLIDGTIGIANFASFTALGVTHLRLTIYTMMAYNAGFGGTYRRIAHTAFTGAGAASNAVGMHVGGQTLYLEQRSSLFDATGYTSLDLTVTCNHDGTGPTVSANSYAELEFHGLS